MKNSALFGAYLSPHPSVLVVFRQLLVFTIRLKPREVLIEKVGCQLSGQDLAVMFCDRIKVGEVLKGEVARRPVQQILDAYERAFSLAETSEPSESPD